MSRNNKRECGRHTNAKDHFDRFGFGPDRRHRRPGRLGRRASSGSPRRPRQCRSASASVTPMPTAAAAPAADDWRPAYKTARTRPPPDAKPNEISYWFKLRGAGRTVAAGSFVICKARSLSSGSSRKPAASDGQKACSRIRAQRTASNGRNLARRRFERPPACHHPQYHTAAISRADRAHWRMA